jgi:hypothetical protein
MYKGWTLGKSDCFLSKMHTASWRKLSKTGETSSNQLAETRIAVYAVAGDSDMSPLTTDDTLSKVTAPSLSLSVRFRCRSKSCQPLCLIERNPVVEIAKVSLCKSLSC